MADISLTASMRSNLLSLQNTQSLMDMTQERLSTGKKVNSAIDNPSSYYTAASLSNRASDLSGLLDSMGQGIQTIQAADEGIEAITSFAQQAKALANTARDEAVVNDKSVASFDLADDYQGATTDKFTYSIYKIGEDAPVSTINFTGTDGASKEETQDAVIRAFDGEDRVASVSFNENGSLVVEAAEGYEVKMTDAEGSFAGLKGTTSVARHETNESRIKSAAQFDLILDQIDQLAADASYKGVNLLQGNNLKVVFNEDRSSSLEIKGVDASSEGLKISRSVGRWQTNEDIDNAIAAVENAITTLRSMATDFGNNYSIVQNREDFTENLINVLEEGADKLTLADMNEESANMLALQTRQQLAINSLSLASQAAQSVLQLF